MKTKNHYHVVYIGFSNHTGQNIQGSLTIIIENPIQYQSDIIDIKAFIESNKNVSNVAIVNWLPLLGMNRPESAVSTVSEEN